MHDPRVGRFFSVDPLTAKYPHYTPYSFSGNKVIGHVELEGLEEVIIHHYENTGEETKIEVSKWSEIPGNTGSHGPRGTGTLHYYHFSWSEKTYVDYDMSLKDIWNSFKGNNKYERPPSEDTDIPATDQGEGEDENIFENFGPQLENSDDETGSGFNDEQKPKKSDSTKVYIWHPNKDGSSGENIVKTVSKEDTVGQVINTKNYGDEYEGNPILDIDN
jgi:hypothetical protein